MIQSQIKLFNIFFCDFYIFSWWDPIGSLSLSLHNISHNFERFGANLVKIIIDHCCILLCYILNQDRMTFCLYAYKKLAYLNHIILANCKTIHTGFRLASNPSISLPFHPHFPRHGKYPINTKLSYKWHVLLGRVLSCFKYTLHPGTQTYRISPKLNSRQKFHTTDFNSHSHIYVNKKLKLTCFHICPGICLVCHRIYRCNSTNFDHRSHLDW